MYKFNCKICSSEFNSKFRNKKYCSRNCYYESRHGKLPWNSGITGYYNKNRKVFHWNIKDNISKVCIGCPELIIGKPSFVNYKKFCNRLCWKRYNIGINNPMYGFKHSNETKNKLSLKKKGYKLSDEQKLKRREKMKNYKNGMLGKHHTENTRKKLSLLTIKQYIEGKMVNSSNTSIEIKMKKLLDELKIEYIHQYNFNNKFVCDFAIPNNKLIIECDGDYWHNYPYGNKKDNAKNAYIQKCGWKILRFWERDINNNIEKCRGIVYGYIN